LTQFPGSQAVHEPAGPQAALLDRLGDLMYGVSVVVFLLVVATLLLAMLRRRSPTDDPHDAARERRMRTVVALASGATAAVLVLVTLVNYATGRELTRRPPTEAVQIRVTGHQWWWEVEYRDSIASNWATTANEIHVPVGRPVVVELRSSDVNHSFWVPNLGVKRDLIPGEETSIWFRADTAGVYRGQCAEFCGHQHAKMALLVVAQPADSFSAWLARQRDTASTPTDSAALRGQEVFLSSSCAMCHAIGGTPAGSRVGPNLTHLASRLTLAAGTLPNTRGNLAGWIVDPQRIKPGSRMPPNSLEPGELDALLAYLGTLR
jgi:cytochrome c oxidase subunit II